MKNHLKKFLLIGSTTAALLLCSVNSGEMVSNAYATASRTTSTAVKKMKYNQVNSNSTSSSTNASNQGVVSKGKNDTATSTTNSTNATVASKPTTDNSVSQDSSSSGKNDASNQSDSDSDTTETGNQTPAGTSTETPANGTGSTGSVATGSNGEGAVNPVANPIVSGSTLTGSNEPVNRMMPVSGVKTASNYSVSLIMGESQAQAFEQTTGNAGQLSANQYLSQLGLGKVNGNSKKSIRNPLGSAFKVSNDKTAANNKIKMVSMNTFYNAFYKKAQTNQKEEGKIVTASGKKAVITTPTKKVNYNFTDKGATTVSESMPVIVSMIVIGIVVVGFVIFDPLRFIFH
ncbi:hypothetical protein [Lentilactobacillus sp. SPB1-3]|uniref:Uncharacterized protein n=1 Tax=Lentilactobacillus terminaliae TaxID=3003483 RepID=A0ACD5DDR3_9LACO|nr:hypothetical protein [Lentilactobacillus sp. SPB1-3]MCZ0977641.1 hypothetical protein [Lentilactobacillus sp. SPB1-3]